VKVAIALGAVVAVAAGCGGSEHRFTKADALKIADVPPAAPGWTWPRNPAEPEWSGASASAVSPDPILTEFRKATSGLVDVGGANKEWEDSNKLAHLDVEVYAGAADAHKSMAPFDTLSRKYATRTGRVTGGGPVRGVGNDGWRLLVSENGPQVTYHWRRDNLVVEAHVHCFGRCPADTDAAARAWVDAIDAAARARS
jgi:hypothetical protein